MLVRRADEDPRGQCTRSASSSSRCGTRSRPAWSASRSVPSRSTCSCSQSLTLSLVYAGSSRPAAAGDRLPANLGQGQARSAHQDRPGVPHAQPRAAPVAQGPPELRPAPATRRRRLDRGDDPPPVAVGHDARPDAHLGPLQPVGRGPHAQGLLVRLLRRPGSASPLSRSSHRRRRRRRAS